MSIPALNSGCQRVDYPAAAVNVTIQQLLPAIKGRTDAELAALRTQMGAAEERERLAAQGTAPRLSCPRGQLAGRPIPPTARASSPCLTRANRRELISHHTFVHGWVTKKRQESFVERARFRPAHPAGIF
jgi:hypothetical protein